MPLAQLSSIRKYYQSSATFALAGADFSVEPGEVHALVGENGAGKSTLAKVLCGFELPDSGTIRVMDTERRFLSHRDAERAGIGFVPQYSMLAPGLSAAENVALGHEPTRLGVFTDRLRAANDFLLLADRFGFEVDPDATVSSLSASARRQVEILRALARGGDILVLDEPTSILGEKETEALFALIRRLKDAGAGIVYISHRAKEILNLADRISVMRSGVVERTVKACDLDERSLAELIVSNEPRADVARSAVEPGAPALALRGVSLRGREADSLHGIDLVVRSGEIVAVVALAGNGLDILEDVASGVARPDSGDVTALGIEIASYRPRELRAKVMSYLPTDREGRGLCPKASVASNTVSKRLFGYSFAEYARGIAPWLDARAALESFAVRNWEKRRVDTLSGGNRQRVVAARELGRPMPIVVAANPAQGLDPSARAALFSRLAAMRDEGSAVLLLSSDPEDAADLADRTFALYRGTLKRLDATDATSLAAAITGACQ